VLSRYTGVTLQTAGLIATWPTLPEPVWAGILAMVEAAIEQRGGRRSREESP
jgi:hypothetical protein